MRPAVGSMKLIICNREHYRKTVRDNFFWTVFVPTQHLMLLMREQDKETFFC